MLYIDLDGVCANFLKASKEISGIEGYDPKIWGYIDKVPNFFYNLEILPDTFRALYLLEDNLISWQYLTALPQPTGYLTTAQRDKVRWVNRKLDSQYQVNCVSNWSQKKYFVYNENDILIDDCERNCKDWEEAGGIAILHTSWEDSLNKLKEIVL